MYQSLELFQTAIAMARHAGTNQASVARNIANADTPGFRAQQVTPFHDAYDGATNGTQRLTRAGHMTRDVTQQSSISMKRQGGEAAPNGNTVSLEEELLNSVAVSREHSRALAIYRHTMTVLRSTLSQ